MKRWIYTAIAAVSAAAIFSPLVASAGEVYHRQVNQQQRIFNGVKAGTIDRQEFRHLQRTEAALNAARVRDLRDGRGLTPQERRQLNRRENQISRDIYRAKHD
jgi:hypothetical protein